jgi:hypothetical protein
MANKMHSSGAELYQQSERPGEPERFHIFQGLEKGGNNGGRPKVFSV